MIDDVFLVLVSKEGHILFYLVQVHCVCPNLNIEVKFATGSAVQSKIEGVRRGKVDILIGSVGGLSKMFSGKLNGVNDGTHFFQRIK